MDQTIDSKQRWAARHTQIKITVSPEIAEEFKARCLAEGVTITSKLKSYMSNNHAKKLPTDPLSTRQKRRKAIKSIICECEAIMEAEQQYIDRMPPNLENAPMHEAAENTVEILGEVLELLGEAYV
jgi:hypothetical protein